MAINQSVSQFATNVMFEFAVCNASPPRPRTASRLTPGCVSSNRYCKTHLRRTTFRDWTLSCGAPSDMVTVRKTLQQSVTCFLLLMNLCSSVSSTMIYTYCNCYYLLKPVSVTIYVLVTTTDNYIESLLTLTTLASSLECSTLTHINCLLLSFTPTFIVCIVYVAICQLF